MLEEAGYVYKELSLLEKKGFVQVREGPDTAVGSCAQHRELSSGSVTTWGDARGTGGACSCR